MEIRIILRGALSGVVAGILGFAFARVFAEPVIDKAIAYESGRDDILAALNKAAGRVVSPDGPEIFSRTIQSTIGIATGIIAFSAAMGALVAVGMAANITIGILSVPHEWVWTYVMLIMFAAVFLLTGAGRSIGVDAFLGPRLEQAGARGNRVARLLAWLA